jgi:hypothetical protein
MTYMYKTLLNLALTVVVVGGCLSKSSTSEVDKSKIKKAIQKFEEELKTGRLKQIKEAQHLIEDLKKIPNAPKIEKALNTTEGKELVKEYETAFIELSIVVLEKDSGVTFNAQEKQEFTNSILERLKLLSKTMRTITIIEELTQPKPFYREKSLIDLRLFLPGLEESKYKNMLDSYEKLVFCIKKAAIGEGQE